MTVTNYQAKLWLKLQLLSLKRQQEAKHKAIVNQQGDKNAQRFPAQLRAI